MAGELPFLSRWSRRKVEAKQGREKAPEAAPATPSAVTAPDAAAAPPEPLPAVDTLTPESDFLPFLKPGVDEGLKRQALRTLFRDPQFNVMDGLDIYIGDYSQPDPIPPEMLARLNQMSHLGVREREPDAETARQGGMPVVEEGAGKDHESAPGPAAVPPPTVAAPADPQPENPGATTRSAPLPEGENPSS